MENCKETTAFSRLAAKRHTLPSGVLGIGMESFIFARVPPVRIFSSRFSFILPHKRLASSRDHLATRDRDRHKIVLLACSARRDDKATDVAPSPGCLDALEHIGLVSSHGFCRPDAGS